MNNKFAIEINDLHRYYGDLKAVEGVSLQIESGSIFSLLGPNGAGKSTAISVISGLLRPTEGDVSIFGKSISTAPNQAKKHIGVVPQDIALYEDLTCRENLAFWGKMYDLRGTALNARINAILEMIELTDRQKDKVEKFSGGMKRRLNIGVALLHEPDIIIMDEPTSMIDPMGKKMIFNILRKLKEAGDHTLIVVEHNVEELAPLADQMLIMNDGQIDKYLPVREFFSDPAFLEERGVEAPESTEFSQWLISENYLPGDMALPLSLEGGIEATRQALKTRSEK